MCDERDYNEQCSTWSAQFVQDNCYQQSTIKQIFCDTCKCITPCEYISGHGSGYDSHYSFAVCTICEFDPYEYPEEREAK